MKYIKYILFCLICLSEGGSKLFFKKKRKKNCKQRNLLDLLFKLNIYINNLHCFQSKINQIFWKLLKNYKKLYSFLNKASLLKICKIRQEVVDFKIQKLKEFPQKN